MKRLSSEIADITAEASVRKFASGCDPGIRHALRDFVRDAILAALAAYRELRRIRKQFQPGKVPEGAFSKSATATPPAFPSRPGKDDAASVNRP